VRRDGEGRRRGKGEKKKEIRGEIRSLEPRGAEQQKGGQKDPQRRKERDERGGKRGEVAEGGDDEEEDAQRRGPNRFQHRENEVAQLLRQRSPTCSGIGRWRWEVFARGSDADLIWKCVGGELADNYPE
jgi:hypothetical protein